mmetsp:Transcript_80914/g.237867  ORF Transcript_80914/g.237867 Transcript_80914/m.237867 type:complete len:362 (-) Transcript_80914:297-1382(-)
MDCGGWLSHVHHLSHCLLEPADAIDQAARLRGQGRPVEAQDREQRREPLEPRRRLVVAEQPASHGHLDMRMLRAASGGQQPRLQLPHSLPRERPQGGAVAAREGEVQRDALRFAKCSHVSLCCIELKPGHLSLHGESCRLVPGSCVPGLRCLPHSLLQALSDRVKHPGGFSRGRATPGDGGHRCDESCVVTSTALCCLLDSEGQADLGREPAEHGRLRAVLGRERGQPLVLPPPKLLPAHRPVGAAGGHAAQRHWVKAPFLAAVVSVGILQEASPWVDTYLAGPGRPPGAQGAEERGELLVELLAVGGADDHHAARRQRGVRGLPRHRGAQGADVAQRRGGLREREARAGELGGPPRGSRV